MRVPTIDCTFASDAVLAESFAQTVAANLRAAIDARGAALIGLSGGSTPREFFKHLSNQELDWNRVTVTLCDDRWVPPTSDRSNERLLRETLLRNKAAAARFVALYVDAPDPNAALPRVQATLANLALPFDVVVLGMGSDGHTASLFPGGDHLAEATNLDTKTRALPMRAPDAPEPRITLTLSALIDTHTLYLHIEGADKKSVFDQAMTSDDSTAPIRTVLKASRVTPIVYWCP